MTDTSLHRHVDWALPLAIWAAVTAALSGALLTLAAPVWLWAATMLWLVLALTALLGQVDGPSRTYIAGTLSKQSFAQIYSYTTRRRLMWVWSRWCDPVEDRAAPAPTFRAALTWRLFDGMLLVAAACPVVFLSGWWIVTGPGIVLAPVGIFADRVVVLIVLVLVVSAVAIAAWGATGNRGGRGKASRFLPVPALLLGAWLLATYSPGTGIAGATLIATAAVVLTAVAVAGRVSGAAAVASLFTGAIAGLVLAGNAGSVPGIGRADTTMLGLAGAAALAVMLLDASRKPRIAQWLLCGMLPLLWLAAAVLLPWATLPVPAKGLFLLLAVLPLLNAVFNVISCALTLTLMRAGLNARRPLLYGAYDLTAAIALLLALGATMTLVVAALDLMSGITVFDLAALFDGIRADPAAYGWLYAMLFVTILPTAVHAFLSLLGAQGLVPLALRHRAALLLNDTPDRTWKAAVAPFAVGALWLVPFVAVAFAGYGLLWAFRDAVEWAGGVYLTLLQALAQGTGAV